MGKYFSEFHQPRKCNGLGDFYSTGLLPELEGIYRLDYLEHDGCGYEEKAIDGVLLSHAHADHAQYIHFLRCDIPLYMTPESEAVLRTLEETGSGTFNELTCIKQTFCLRAKKRGTGMTRLKGDEATEDRDINLVETGETFKIGSVEITPFRVDHSLPGAASYLIHTSEGNIFYTGDLRFHGYRSSDTEYMVEAVTEEGVEVMISEGTRIDDVVGTTEDYVREESKKIVENTSGLVAVNFPQRDLDRLITFHKVAIDTDRKLVLGLKHAFLLELMNQIGDYPALDDPSISFFADRKSWGLIGRDDYPESIIKQDYQRWEREYLNLDNTINYRDVQKNQSEYLFYCNFFQL
jgi:ribonuclease J